MLALASQPACLDHMFTPLRFLAMVAFTEWEQPMRDTKISKLKAAMLNEDWPLALRIAARFPRLGAQKNNIVRAHEALVHPHFYRQLRRDPDALVERGITALKQRYPNR